MIREANHPAESKDPYPIDWPALIVLSLPKLESRTAMFLLATRDPSTA